MSGAPTVGGFDDETPADPPEKNTIESKATTIMPTKDAIAHFGIGDFNFLLEAALGATEVCLRGEGFCGLAACGAVTLI